MKTLDEVIKALEICIDPKGCGNCPYADYDGAPGCFGEEREDALKHLKKYRKLLDSQKSAKMENKPACVSEMENKPLTLEELKQMEGKPVWIVNERLGWAGWEIVWNFPGNKMETRDDSWNIDEMGTEWNAYRKERTDGEEG